MKFVCGQCSAKYSIADEKVKNKVLKIRCKRCSNIIVVRESAGAVAAKASTPRPAPAPVQAPAPQPAAPAPRPQASVDFSAHSFVHEPEQSERTVIARIPMGWLEQQQEKPSWFAALQGNPVGPITKRELEARISSREIDEQTLIWDAGWPDWVPAGTVDDFRIAFREAYSKAEVAHAFATADQEIDQAIDQFGEGLFQDQTVEPPQSNNVTAFPSAPAASQGFSPQSQSMPLAAQSNQPVNGGFQADTPAPNPWGGQQLDFDDANVKPSSSPFGGGFGQGALHAKSEAQSQADAFHNNFPFPNAATQPQQPLQGQDVAHEDRALPAGIEFVEVPQRDAGVAAQSVGTASGNFDGAEADFFALGEGNFLKRDEMVEVELPPIPIMEEEEEILEVDNDAIVEIQAMRPKWGPRLIALGSIGAVAAIVALAMIYGPSNQFFVPKHKTFKFKKVKNSKRKLTEKQRKMQEMLLNGGKNPNKGSVDAKALAKKKKKYRVYKRATKNHSGDTKVSGPTINIKSSGPSEVDKVIAMMRKTGIKVPTGGFKKTKKVGFKGSATEIKIQQRLYPRLNSNNKSVKYCYEQYLKKVVTEGRMILQLTIQPSGALTKVRVVRKFRGPIQRCILRRVKRWHFPGFSDLSGKPYTLEVPYEFKPRY